MLVDVPYIPHSDTLFFTVPEDAEVLGADYAILPSGIESNGMPYLGLNEFKEVQWSISPNPAIKSVEIAVDHVVKTIQVIAVDGTVVSEVHPDSLKTILDISHLKQGVYLIRLDQSAPKRLIVTK
ncbi:hypothetical protein D3C85_1451420 [compost metagenome]